MNEIFVFVSLEVCVRGSFPTPLLKRDVSCNGKILSEILIKLCLRAQILMLKRAQIFAQVLIIHIEIHSDFYRFFRLSSAELVKTTLVIRSGNGSLMKVLNKTGPKMIP